MYIYSHLASINENFYCLNLLKLKIYYKKAIKLLDYFFNFAILESVLRAGVFSVLCHI